MKIIFTLMLLLSTLMFGQGLDKLEKSYLSKAETLQSKHDVIAKANDAKLATDSKRLAESYLRALKGILKAETKKGNFDAAIAIKAKIVEIETILSGDVKPVVPVVKPVVRPVFKARSIILAKVKSTSPKNAGPIISDKYGNFSPELKGARLYNYNKVDKNMIENGAGEFEILESGIVYLALHYHFDGDDNGGWTDSRWTLKQFNDAGWTNVNWNLYLLNRDKRYDIVKKYCKKGETYKLRCNKYIPPQLLFPVVADPVVGKWLNILSRNKNSYYHFKADNTVINLETNLSGIWKSEGNGVYSVKWNNNNRWQYSHKIINNGQSLYHGNRVYATRSSIDPIIGKWNWDVRGSGIFTFSADGNIVATHGVKGIWKNLGNNKYLLTFNFRNPHFTHDLILNGDKIIVTTNTNKTFTSMRSSK